MKKSLMLLTAITAALLVVNTAIAGDPVASSKEGRAIDQGKERAGAEGFPAETCEEVLTQRNERIRELEHQVRTLTPGTCEYNCRERSDQDNCIAGCLSRW